MYFSLILMNQFTVSWKSLILFTCCWHTKLSARVCGIEAEFAFTELFFVDFKYISRKTSHFPIWEFRLPWCCNRDIFGVVDLQKSPKRTGPDPTAVQNKLGICSNFHIKFAWTYLFHNEVLIQKLDGYLSRALIWNQIKYIYFECSRPRPSEPQS